MRSKSWSSASDVNPLTLLAGYKRNPAAFARPGPPPEPPLPLKFTCKACSREIAPNTSRCGWCGELMWGVDH